MINKVSNHLLHALHGLQGFAGLRISVQECNNKVDLPSIEALYASPISGDILGFSSFTITMASRLWWYFNINCETCVRKLIRLPIIIAALIILLLLL